jgi:membrane protein implicated in regulation of membrane protease activity
VFLIVGVVLLLLLPYPWNVVGGTCAFVLFLGELSFWHRRVRDQPKKVGAQNLIGQTATVVSPCRPKGQVRIGGEIWAARCPGGVDHGDTVRVVDRDGLTLIVEPVVDAPREGVSETPPEPG